MGENAAVIAVEVDTAVIVPDEGVLIPVPIYIYKDGGAATPHIHPVQGVICRWDLGESTAVIAEEVDVAIIFANEDVLISVIVYVNKAGGAFPPHIYAIEEVAGAGDFRESAAGILEEPDNAVAVPDEGV